MANIFKLFKNLFKGPFIADAPLELLQCEYGCRVRECNYGKWRNCENRIRRMDEEIAFLQSEASRDQAANLRPTGGEAVDAAAHGFRS